MASKNLFHKTLRIIDTKNLDRLSKWIETGKVYFGGNLNRDKRFISPTTW